MSFKPCKVTLTVASNPTACQTAGRCAELLGLTTEAISDDVVLVYDAENNHPSKDYFESISLAELFKRLDQYEAEQRRATERLQAAAQPDPMSRQVGGNHYAKLAIQPTEYTARNGLGFLEGNVIKYVTRHADKDGVKDIDKAIHYLEMIKHYQYGGEK